MTRSVRLILLASLALNLALGASLAWLVFQPGRAALETRQRETPTMFRPEALRRALPKERSEVVDAVLARHRDAMHTRIRAQSQARDGVREALRAEPFERSQLEDAFARLRDAEGHTAEEAHALLVDLASRATPEERERLSRIMKNRHGSRERHKSDH